MGKGFIGKKHTEETKRKISIAKQECRSPMLGKHHSERTKKKISQALIGSKNPNWKGGIYEYPQYRLFKKHRTIILIYNPDCEICGNPAREVHHKDFTKDNHKLSNLVALCNSCHKFLHNWKTNIRSWKGSFQCYHRPAASQ